MLAEKIELTIELKEFIKRTRKEHKKTLLDLEEKSKYNHKAAWYSQVEGKRTKTIKRNDIIDIYKIILDTSEEEAEKYIEDFIFNYNNTSISSDNDSLRIFDVYDQNNNETYLKYLDDILNTIKKFLYQVYDNSKDKEKAITLLQIFSNNILLDIGFMLSLNCLKWDRLEQSSDDIKSKILQEINDLIQNYGSLSSIDKALAQVLQNYRPETDRPDFTKLFKELE